MQADDLVQRECRNEKLLIGEGDFVVRRHNVTIGFVVGAVYAD